MAEAGSEENWPRPRDFGHPRARFRRNRQLVHCIEAPARAMMDRTSEGPNAMATRSFLLAIAFLTGLAGLARADDIDIAGQTVSFAPGSAYCALDGQQYEYDRLMLDWQRQAQAGSNQLVQIFQNCTALEGLRQGQQNGKFGRYSIVLMPLTNGQPTQVPGMTREMLLAELTKVFSKGIELDTKSVEQRLNESLDSVTGQDVGEIGISGVKQLGMLDQDSNALYQGLVLTASANNQTTVTAGIVAMSMVKGYVVSYNVYDDYVDESTFTSLLAEAKDAMRYLVENNP
jgi:hypothetical protein